MRARRVTPLVALALVGVLQPPVTACTAFCARGSAGQVLAGNNEDWDNARHLRLETHIETRSFEALVLRATAAPRLDGADPHEPAIRIGDHDLQCRSASIALLAGALQSVLGRPVIDETNLTGAYNLQLGWDADRAGSIAAMLRDRFGLTLTPARRDLDALVVDGIRRDPAMFLLAQAGSLLRHAPPYLRQRIASGLAVD